MVFPYLLNLVDGHGRRDFATPPAPLSRNYRKTNDTGHLAADGSVSDLRRRASVVDLDFSESVGGLLSEPFGKPTRGIKNGGL
jgi:hypothetical protein